MVLLAVGEGTDGLQLKDGDGMVWVMLLGFAGCDAGLLRLMAAASLCCG